MHRSRVLVVLLAVTVFGVVLPVAPTEAQVAAAAAPMGDMIVDSVSRAAFLADQVDGGEAAAAAADAIGTEASGEATGADGDEDLGGPVPEEANPAMPDPDEEVLPEGEAQVTAAEPMTVEARGPPEGGPEDTLDPEDEVVSMRTAQTKTFANEDGTFTTQSSVDPMHVRRGGEWVDVDPELVQAEDGTFVNGPAPVDIALAEDGAADDLAVVERPTGPRCPTPWRERRRSSPGSRGRWRPTRTSCRESMSSWRACRPG